MSCLSALFILDLKGKIIIFRNYRGEVDQDVSEVFQREVFEKDEDNMKPCFTNENTHYCWKRYQNIYLVAVGKRNLNITIVFSYISKLINVLTNYFKVLDEESVKDNFVIIYELMDETIDHGYPQITDPSILKEYIKTQSNKKQNNVTDTKKELELTEMQTGVVPWRKPGIVHSKNEIYMDVIEKVTCLVNSNCNSISSEVRGCIKVKCTLSGMPTCTLGLNDRAYLELNGKYDETMKNKTIEIDDFKFHPCVQLDKFDTEREIEFIPADGEFELMNYRLDVDLKPLIWVDLEVDIKSETRHDYVVIARTNFKQRSIASNCDIFIPVPIDVIKCDCKTNLGSAKWDPSLESVVWNVKQFQGQVEGSLRISIVFPSVRIGIFLFR